jgi:ATP-dependent Clp protease ATP-binding subunit ClpC
MFERYTEAARRVIFFARYETSQLGRTSIETEHLLLGLMREGRGVPARLFRNNGLSMQAVRKEIEGRAPYEEHISTAVDVPLSDESKRVLAFAAEEAERVPEGQIGPEHLLLGLLREEQGLAAHILGHNGLHLSNVREQILELLKEKAVENAEETALGGPVQSAEEGSGPFAVDRGRLFAEIAELKRLILQLAERLERIESKLDK